MDTKHVVSGERIQEIADIYIGMQEDFDFNPRIRTQTSKQLLFGSIPTVYDNPAVVFVYTHRVDEFAKYIDRFTNPFTLLTHNSDGNVTTTAILDHPLLRHWYAQNVCVQHPKLTPIPIGIQNSQWNARGLEYISSLHVTRKTQNVYFNFNVNTNSTVRAACYEALKGKIPFLPMIDANNNLRRLADYKFCICPEGNGVDTHRFWEALYLKVIPIVLDSELVRAFQRDTRIPVVVLKAWSDLDVSRLEYSFGTYLPDISLESYRRRILQKDVTFVLTCLTNFQEYILVSIRNLLHHGNTDIVVLTEPEFFRHFEGLPVVLVDRSEFSDVAFDSKLDKDFRGGFWHLTSLRLFVLHAYLKRTNTLRCVHIENDVMVYANANNVRWHPDRMSVVYDAPTRVIPSVVWVPTPDTLGAALRDYDGSKNDMENLARADLERLPIFPDNWTLGSPPFVHAVQVMTATYPEYDYIFDGAAIGQYLGGVDPRNQSGDTRGFVNETCLLNYSHYPVSWTSGCPMMNVGGRTYRIFNLHVHSKRLEDFASTTQAVY
jgi:hypothetical protein